MKEPLHVTTLLAYEFRQSLRFQVWRRAANPREGVAPADAQAALKPGTEVYCQFCFIRIFIKKHKRPRKEKWLRLLQCVPFICRTMECICWFISN